MTTAPEVTAEVQDFLRDRILSYEQLETLLLLRRRREESLSAKAVAERLHVSEQAATDVLGHLSCQNLLEVRVGKECVLFSYQPENADVESVVEQLADSYKSNRLVVMNLMNANAMDRVRMHARNVFTRAPLFGRKKGMDG